MIDEAELDFLRHSSADQWNRRRQECGFTHLDFHNVDLLNGVFNGFNFSNCNLRYVNFMYSELKNVDFSNTDLSFADLSSTVLKNAIFLNSQLIRTQFYCSNLSNATFSNVVITHVDFTGSLLHDVTINHSGVDFCTFDDAKIVRSSLSEVSLMGSSFFKANLSHSKFANCNFKGSIFIETDINESIFEDCSIFGISCWKIAGTPRVIQNLNIADFNENRITVDNLEVAQFLYLILNNKELQSIINTVTTKLVLILGRFSDEQKPILNHIREKLPDFDLIPVIFDFDCPCTRDADETVSILASLSKFVIVDITDPRSTPQELKGIVEGHPSIPIQPIIRENQREYGMYDHFRSYHWVQPIQTYKDLDDLSINFEEKIIQPINIWFEENRT
jgi:uncharacterized protein YjbI with pentapeptide repeats